jgi:hypothetical protein
VPEAPGPDALADPAGADDDAAGSSTKTPQTNIVPAMTIGCTPLLDPGIHLSLSIPAPAPAPAASRPHSAVVMAYSDTRDAGDNLPTA